MTRLTTIKQLLAFGLVLLASGVPAWAATRPDDKDISFWVQEALRDDPRVMSSHIVAQSHEGVVKLTGEVRNLAEKQYARLESEKIAGVAGVVDELLVKPEFRFDSDIAGDIRLRLFDCPAVNLHWLDVDVADGVATLRGKVESWSEKHEASLIAGEVRGVRDVKNELTIEYPTTRPDEEIEQDVRAAIQRDVYLVGLPITVNVKKGVVTIAGEVGSAHAKRRATNAAWVGNVMKVRNQLKVEWWENRGERRKNPMPSDADIARTVIDELYQDLRITTPYEVTAQSKSGHVMLRGTVPTYYQKQLAERDAKDVVGVGWVTNYLVVKTDMRSDSAIQRDVEQRFDTDYQVNGQDLGVRVNDGVVTLSGNTNTYHERSHAVDVAARVSGVNQVVDQIKVNWFHRFTDATLQKHVKDRLHQHEATRYVADLIKVKVTNGIAHLTGNVFDWSERAEAERVALLTDGVVAVDNGVTVDGADYPWVEWQYPASAYTDVSALFWPRY